MVSTFSEEETLSKIEGALLNAKYVGSKTWSVSTDLIESVVQLLQNQILRIKDLDIGCYSSSEAANFLGKKLQECEEQLKNSKRLAYKEFADELTNRIVDNENIVNRDSWYITDTIEKLLDEMVGDE